MKLKTLQITNFRCFESLEMDLHDQLTVIVAKNGQGKSSILDAIRIGLWSFVSGFDLAKNTTNNSGNNISVDDILIKKIDDQLYRCVPCEITLQGDWNIKLINFSKYEKTWKWTRFRKTGSKREKTKNTSISKVIKILANIAQDQISNPEHSNTDLPVLGYYGTGRLWSQKKLTKIRITKKDNDVYMRLFAYKDCLDPASSYKHFADWFIWIFECYREDQIKNAEKGTNIEPLWKNTILVIQQAINQVLKTETGWYDLEYSVSDEKSLILHHDELGKLKVEQLSDGIRGILAMVGDIAYRCIKLNPHLGLNATKETSGIVMIDEIELHLHPAWQQNILLSLCNAFPNIQFIVTTHSPQVISTVASEQIRILDNGVVYAAQAGTKGAESKRILKQVFGVESRPQNDSNVKLLNEYLDLAYKDKWNEPDAKEKRLILDTIYQGNEPALTAADLHIENRQWELENEEDL